MGAAGARDGVLVRRSWQHGSKDYHRFVGRSLAQRGFVAVLPDYRLAPDKPFPALVEDTATTVRWARDHAREFGGDLALDPGYLDADGLAPKDLAGVVSLAGPTGLENLHGEALKGVFPRATPDDAFSPIALATRHAEAAPPILLTIGLGGNVIHASSVARLADAIRAGGGAVTVKACPATSG